MTKLTMTATSPFSLAPVVHSHGWVQLPPFRFNAEAGILYTIARLGAERVVGLTMEETRGGVAVAVEADLDFVEKQDLHTQVTRMLGLNQDFSHFYALAREEPRLAQMEAKAQGRILRCPTLFEDMVKTLLTTNTSWAGTIRMVTNVVEALGDAPPVPPPKGMKTSPAYHAFPSPECLAAVNERTLRELGLGYRAPYVLELARRVASGDLDLAAFEDAERPTPELRRRLLTIKGIGPYAAASLLMLLGRYDFVPVDSWARQMVSRAWHDGEPVTDDDVTATFAHWGRWQGLAYWFWDW